jgi:lambda family phage portal protein
MAKRIESGAVPPIYSGVAGRLSRMLDGVLEIVAPVHVHRKRKARMQSAALMAFEAAQISRTNEPRDRTGSADADLLPDLKALRDSSRVLVRDDPHGASQALVLEENVIGTGIRPLPMLDPEQCGVSEKECAAFSKSCLAEWERWAEDDADVTGHGTVYDLQALVARSLLSEGEMFAHAIDIGGGDLACELLDSDRIESPGKLDRDRMRGGVETDEIGRPVAIWVLDHHPDDIAFLGRYSAQPRRIPVRAGPYSIVQHVFRRDRPGQTRGIPWLVAAVTFSKHLHHYIASELIAARANSNVAMMIKKAASELDPDIFPVDMGDGSMPGEQSYEQVIKPGTIQHLNPGEDIAPFLPNRPGTSFDPFVQRILRASAASTGMCYELIAKDMGQLNYSSARSLLIEVRRTFDKTRSKIARQFLRPWWENVVLRGVVSGRITAPAQFLANPRPFMRARWVPPAYGWVDPKVEVEASSMAVEANLSTPYNEAQRSGLDAHQVLRERAKFFRESYAVEDEFELDRGTLTRKSSEPIATSSDDPQPEADGSISPPGAPPPAAGEGKKAPPAAAPAKR